MHVKPKMTSTRAKEQLELLERLRQLAAELGRTPLKKECPFSSELKLYLGTWHRVCECAGLPKPVLPEQAELRKREKAAAENSGTQRAS